MNTYFKHLKNYYSYTFLLKVAFFITAILIVLDYFNLLTGYINNLDNRVLILILMSLIFISILVSIDLHLIDIFKFVSISTFDMLLMILILSSLLYSIAALVLSIFYIYKIIIISIFLLIGVCVLVYRIDSFKTKLNLRKSYKSNVIDLKQIFENDFEVTKDTPILLEEKDVDYDLLNRSRTINLLYSSILNCKPTNSFVISLEGKWGSGKTTIINNTKSLLQKPEHEDIVIIDDLDLWSYETPESLFNSMFERILNQSNINFNAYETREMINSAYTEIFNDKKINALKSIIFSSTNLMSVKDKINDQLALSNKKVVFFIDNIDRTEKENIILLFKLVSNILDFERVVYVLSFDNERVQKIFNDELNIDYSYLKKIIQMQIRVPQLDKKALLEVLETSVSNILVKLGESPQSTTTTHSDLIKFIANNTDDLRDFKRFINSALNISYKTITFLNKGDLLTLEYIRLNNINLYETIFNNPNLFISHDRDINLIENITLFNRENHEKEVRDFYDKLFSNDENKLYLVLLKKLFPYIENYVHNKSFTSSTSITTTSVSFESIAKGKRVCSQKFFSLYFNYTSNEYIYISEVLDQFIKKVTNNPNHIEEIYSALLNESLKPHQHKEFMERLAFYLNEFNVNIIYNLLNVLFDNLLKVDAFKGFISLSARTRVIIIIWNLLQMISEEEYDMFISRIRTDYQKITNVNELLYWFKNDRDGKSISSRYEKLDATHKASIEAIISGEVNIYADRYYQVGNLKALYSVYADNNEVLKEYIKKIVNERNIYRFLRDLLGSSSGSNGVSYYINEETFLRFTSRETIDPIIFSVPPSKEEEKIILEIYKNHIIEDKGNSLSDMGLRFPKYLELNL